MSVTRTSILLDHDLLLEVQQLARARGTTMTAIVREALKAYVGRRRRGRKLSFTAVGKSGQRSVAKNAETILRRAAKRYEGW